MKTIARAWAGLDLVVTGVLAFPPTGRLVVDLVRVASGRDALIGTALETFFVCLAGALGVIWALARLHDPRRPLVLADALGRVWVAGLIVWFVLLEGAPWVLLAFVVTELAGALHQGRALQRAANAEDST